MCTSRASDVEVELKKSIQVLTVNNEYGIVGTSTFLALEKMKMKLKMIIMHWLVVVCLYIFNNSLPTIDYTGVCISSEQIVNNHVLQYFGQVYC